MSSRNFDEKPLSELSNTTSIDGSNTAYFNDENHGPLSCFHQKLFEMEVGKAICEPSYVTFTFNSVADL